VVFVTGDDANVTGHGYVVAESMNMLHLCRNWTPLPRILGSGWVVDQLGGSCRELSLLVCFQQSS